MRSHPVMSPGHALLLCVPGEVERSRTTGLGHRWVITLPRVKNFTPSGPYMCVSPTSESFQPPNECHATGTGIGTLIPTIPTCTARWNVRAASPDDVNIAVPLP